VPEIAAKCKTPKDMGMFYRKSATGSEKDDFCHEMLLVIEEGNGTTVFTGCSHKGILNFVSSSEAQFPQMDIRTIVGGLHMMNPATKRLSESKTDVRLVGSMLFKNDKVTKLYTGHCTGEMAYSMLKLEMSEKLEPIMVGLQFAV